MTDAAFPPKIIAAIDVGTNSAHMVIAQMDHVGEMRLLDTDKVTLRLGQAIDEEGNISAEAIQRTVETLKHMKDISQVYKPTLRVVATHATREARNHRALEDAVLKECGLRIEIIDGIEEARLVFLGMRYGLSFGGSPAFGADVGGGSTELIIATDDEIDYVSSIKVGAVTQTSRFFPDGKYTKKNLALLREHIRLRLSPMAEEARLSRFEKAIASSGTAKALAYMHARMFRKIELSDPNGYVIPAGDLLQMTDKLASLLTPKKIKEEAEVDSDRAEIILAGALILEELTRQFQVEEWTVTTYGLREGLVADTFYRIYEDLHKEGLPDIRTLSVTQFAGRLRINQNHGRQVARIALRLHDLLVEHVRPKASDGELHENRKLLRSSAFLHEAGKFLSAPQYHKHSHYLITNSRLPGFTEFERNMMGLIARYHRKSIPSSKSRHTQDLSDDDVERLKFLAGTVRMATALNRSRQNRVKDINCEKLKDGTMRVYVDHTPDETPDVELFKTRQELPALEKSFGFALEITARPGQTASGLPEVGESPS